MSSKGMSLKGRIKNYAKRNNIQLKLFCKIICLNVFWNVCLFQSIVKSLL